MSETILRTAHIMFNNNFMIFTGSTQLLFQDEVSTPSLFSMYHVHNTHWIFLIAKIICHEQMHQTIMYIIRIK